MHTAATDANVIRRAGSGVGLGVGLGVGPKRNTVIIQSIGPF
jgi:hypothetical protein